MAVVWFYLVVVLKAESSLLYKKMRRITRRPEYLEIYKNSKRVYSYNFTFMYQPANELAIGMSITKKLGNAVTRNLLKRRLRAFLRLYRPNFEARIVILPQSKAAGLPWDTLKNELVYLFKKLENLCN